jgi:hypothetical protein
MLKLKSFSIKQLVKGLRKLLARYWRKNAWHKVVTVFFVVLTVLVVFIFGIGTWYRYSQRNVPLQMGVSFIPDYAESLGVNPQQNMQALLNIGVREFRLTSYWSDIEPTPGHYDFSQLDWEFALAQKYHAKIILSVGLRQPRYPECHPPSWVNTADPESQWEPQLKQFMTQVVDRYKNSPSLYQYQVENEYFLQGFGTCNNDDRTRLVSEYNLVAKLDPKHEILITRSNNALGWPVGQPHSQLYGISIYRRTWDANLTHRYLEYPFPAFYYGFLAGIEKIVWHKQMVIHELQAEAWAPNGKTIPEISLAEQNKSINAARLKNQFSFGRSTGMKQIELWGGEYWYYRMVVLHDPSLWNVAKQEFSAKN